MGTPGYSGDGGPATSAQLKLPTSMTVDAAGNLYIAVNGNSVLCGASARPLESSVESDTAFGIAIEPTRVAVDSTGGVLPYRLIAR